MSLRTIDARLIELVDRALAGPQRRGVPLPKLIAGAFLLPIPAVGLCLAANRSHPWPTPFLWLAFTGIVAVFGAVNARRVVRDARDWSRWQAGIYDATALKTRENGFAGRAFYIVAIPVMIAVTGLFAATLGPLSGAALSTAPMAAVLGSFLFLLLSLCARPRASLRPTPDADFDGPPP